MLSQDKDLLQGPGKHRVHIILLCGPRKHHVQEARSIVQVISRINDGVAPRRPIRNGGQCWHARYHPEARSHARCWVPAEATPINYNCTIVHT